LSLYNESALNGAGAAACELRDGPRAVHAPHLPRKGVNRRLLTSMKRQQGNFRSGFVAVPLPPREARHKAKRFPF